MFALDLQIRRRTEGAQSSTTCCACCGQRYGAPREPHPDELQPLFEEATGLSLGEVFDRQIRGTEDPELAEELAPCRPRAARRAPIRRRSPTARSAVWLGITRSGTRSPACSIDSPAQAAGLSPGDELIAIDRFRATGDGELRSLLGARKVGDRVTLSLFRRHKLVEVPVDARCRTPDSLRDLRCCGSGPRGGALPGVARRGPSGCAEPRRLSRRRRGGCDFAKLPGCDDVDPDRTRTRGGRRLLEQEEQRPGTAARPGVGREPGLDAAARRRRESACRWRSKPAAAERRRRERPGSARRPPRRAARRHRRRERQRSARRPPGGAGANPHGGGGPAGMDTSTMGALAPDPNRPIDPAHHIRGLSRSPRRPPITPRPAARSS